MMTLEQIKMALIDLRPSIVAEETGLHFNTVRDVRDNPDVNPTYRVLKSLSDYLTNRDTKIHG
jgi:hypothetical protein